MLWTAFDGRTATGIVDEDLSHQFSCNRDKMRTIFDRRGIGAGHTKVNLVHQLSALQGMIGPLIAQTAVSGEAQFLIDQWDKSRQRFLIPAPPASE